jgi:transposase
VIHSASSAVTTDAQALLARIELLEQENRWLKSQLFGRASEKTPPAQRNPDQRWLFNEAEALVQAAERTLSTATIAAHARRRGGRKVLAAHLPRVDVLHDLPEDQKVCAGDGTQLKRIGEEISEQLEFRPARARVIRNIRPKYACPCCKRGVAIAALPAQLFPKSIATPSLAAQITTAKFVDGTPLYRQEPQFARMGITLGRATMAAWMIRLGCLYVVPLINLLRELMLSDPLIHCDETHLQVLRSDKSPTSDHWMWVRASGPPGRRLILFDYDPSRAGSVPRRLLDGFQGVVLTDGYEAYDALARTLQLTHAGCFAHVRRKFDEALKASGAGAKDGHAEQALAFFRELYLVERALWDPHRPVSAQQRVQVRIELSAPIIAKFRAWLEALAPQVLPQSLLGKAVHYALRQWPKLTVFLRHGEVPLDNNRCENAIRPFVIGRKGWLFSDTVKGAVASANLYSLVETAKANGVEPHAYLTHVFERLPHAKTVADFESLLPWNVPVAAHT